MRVMPDRLRDHDIRVAARLGCELSRALDGRFVASSLFGCDACHG
jgi:hypothetical protein